jgi:hypothetical protein
VGLRPVLQQTTRTNMTDKPCPTVAITTSVPLVPTPESAHSTGKPADYRQGVLVSNAFPAATTAMVAKHLP